MALVTKNDVTQIFAIQAPEIDLPPTFANYPRGWDTARSNNGKPTIKQFNYIQQRTDQNMLWIHQNGAALPYDAAMEYAENSHVVKDGELQKKQGASWIIPFMRGSQNLAELTDVAQARTKLDVYSKSEVLAKENNLSELTDKVVARTNLGVYSKAETDNIAATPNATETVAGKAKIATTAIAQAGTDDTDIITAKKLRDALNAGGDAPIYSCRAWVNFNGTGTVAIRASGNVSSITDNGVGLYTVNFTTAMQDVNYAAIANYNYANTAVFNSNDGNASCGNYLTTSVRLAVMNGAADALDAACISVSIFR